MTQRRLLRPQEILPLVGLPDRARTLTQRRLDRCASVWDVRRMALRRAPRAVFDYVDGAAMSETSLRRSREAFRRVEFTPRVLRDVADVDTSIETLGGRNALPFLLAPTGFTRMLHTDGETAVARVAAEKGIAYGLSTLGTTSIEELAAASPDTRRWFQLYVNRDRARPEDLMHRAGAHGYDTLILTVDTAVGGIRRREVRNGLTIPPQLTVGTLAEMALHPRWWFDVLTTEPLSFASLSTTGGTVGDLLTRVFDPGITGEDVAWIREHWSGRVMIKGIQSLEDARIAADLGVDALVLSNHGGRQVDMGNAPLELLPEVAAAVGDRVEVYLDGGIMSGTDVVAAVALGARGVLVGRAYLYGLMAGGEDGVRRVLDILEKEVRTTMQLIGARTVDEVRQAEVRLRPTLR
ncbi:MAG: alpha-hydroxy-acid oxidizing enzyme [Actinomycetales bacterium]|nr:alpha-hydroxy-acid oxidizing enzyme [Actinomycetales bacterium]